MMFQAVDFRGIAHIKTKMHNTGVFSIPSTILGVNAPSPSSITRFHGAKLIPQPGS